MCLLAIIAGIKDNFYEPDFVKSGLCATTDGQNLGFTSSADGAYMNITVSSIHSILQAWQKIL